MSITEETCGVSTAYSQAAQQARNYYNGSDANGFYSAIWGGEDIHIGIYERPDDSIRNASYRTVQRMASACGQLVPGARVIDLGSGYGGAARYLASKYRCRVECLDVSETHNQRNVEMTSQAGLADGIRVTSGSFEELPFAAARFDVVWSQDAILHSGRREEVVSEAARMLRGGGEFIFTDIMQTDNCPEHALGPILERIRLESLGTLSFYRDVGSRCGLTEIGFTDLSSNVTEHYRRVHLELSDRYVEMVDRCGRNYVDRMLQGLARWVDAGERGYLCWGILRFEKKR